MILIVHTDRNDVLGGFVDQEFQIGVTRFTGTGDCFIFTWRDGKYEGHKSTNENQFYFHADSNGFGFGSEYA